MKEVKLYQPSNGTEGDYFMDEFCFNCVHDNYTDENPRGACPILMMTMAFNTKDDGYPNQWRYVDGKPKCLAFNKR